MLHLELATENDAERESHHTDGALCEPYLLHGATQSSVSKGHVEEKDADEEHQRLWQDEQDERKDDKWKTLCPGHAFDVFCLRQCCACQGYARRCGVGIGEQGEIEHHDDEIGSSQNVCAHGPRHVVSVGQVLEEHFQTSHQDDEQTIGDDGAHLIGGGA